ncbi:MAG TPA: 2-oxoacid:acceptor oxidoreductase family protein [Vicinamibacterales bacterium]|nr:2-oxoacid:acceptor oxidoreductase family protein [Acidobacteriota bacterium]HOC19042.1 2-oxoacid:acceptor oxidoreductase family protein [Vicinamibacterales bacterium]
MTYDIVLAGFGGQGILFLGKMIATAGMIEGKEVSWIPSYGPEMRGGTANCSVVVSDKRIGTPVVSRPNVLVAMNRPSLEKFEPKMAEGGFLLINRTLIEIPHTRTDIEVAYIGITGIAGGLGNPRLANVVALGALIARVPIVGRDSALAALRKELSGKKAALLDLNFAALDAGLQAAAQTVVS